MSCTTHKLLFRSHLKALSVLVFHLLLTHSSRGESQLTGPSQPIIAILGDDVILPCQLKPVMDATGMTLEWTRPDLNPRFVHVWRDGVELVGKKHKSFEGRTSLFMNELKNGNISLKLSNVTFSDRGTYRCFIPGVQTQSHVLLVVASGAVSSPIINLAGIDRDKEGVVLQCESKGWYPQPEVFWLDGDGNLLSAGPTETVRGPDGLYTVSSRVTVEKRHSNSFTCGVQQNNINQTRETHIKVADDFFVFPLNSAAAIITGLAVCLAVCIMLILAVVFFVWRKTTMKKTRSFMVTNEKGQHTEMAALNTEQKDKDQPITTPTVSEKSKGENNVIRNMEEAENTLKTMEQELEGMTKVENKYAELQELREQQQKKKDDLQMLTKKLQTKDKELLDIRNSQSIFSLGLSKENQQRKDQVDNEIEELKKEEEIKENELKAVNEEIEEKQGEFQELCGDVLMTETILQRLVEKLWTSKKELEESKFKVLQLQHKKQSQEHDDVTMTCRGYVRGGVFVEFDQDSKYVRVKNISKEDQPMESWELHIQADNKQPIIYTFIPSFTLKIGESVNIGLSNIDVDHNPSTNLVLWKSWDPVEKLLVTLLCSNGEEIAKTEVKNTIQPNSDHFR